MTVKKVGCWGRLFKNWDHHNLHFNEVLWSLEAKWMVDINSLFYLISLGDLPILQKKIGDPPKFKIDGLDPTGATIIHKAYLLKHYEMGHWLVKKFPNLALKGYSGDLPQELITEGYTPDDMPYTGANVLHIVILRKDYGEVRWLLDFYKDNGLAILLSANATGRFFGPNGDFYFGGYPLQFAVCTNSIQIFDLVYAATIIPSREEVKQENHTSLSIGPNAIFMRDSFGNTIVHLCAIHGLKSMFQHVCETAKTTIRQELQLLNSSNIRDDPNRSMSYKLSEVDSISHGQVGYKLKGSSVKLPPPDQLDKWLISETKNKMDERLLYALNKSLHSPLTLAASISRKPGDNRGTIFKELLAYYGQPLWTYGPISCTNLCLDGVDTVYDLRRFEPIISTTVKCKSALHWLNKSKSLQCFQLPEVKAIIETKWSSFGLVLFILDGVVDVAIIVLTTLILLFVNFSPTTHPKHTMDWFINVLYAITFIVFLAICISECFVWKRIGFYFSRVHGVVYFHVFCRSLKVVSFFLFLAFQLYDGSANVDQADDIYSSALKSPQDSKAVKIPLAVCVMTAWVHSYYYLVGFERTGPFLLVLSRIILNDLPYFFIFFIFVLLAFASSISMVSNDISNISFGFSRLVETLFGLIQKTVNVMPTTIYPAGVISVDNVAIDLQWVQDIQIVLFYGTVNLLLVNLLIAIMSSTYGKYSSFNAAYFLLEKCHIMEYLEMHLTEEELQVFKNSYSYKNTVQQNTINGNKPPHLPNSFSMVMTNVRKNWLESAPSSKGNNDYTTLFIVDPQRDFHPGGSLAVPGADADSKRIADMIMKNKHNIHEIFVSLDSHHPSHIAHAAFWVDKKKKKNPAPFTTITYKDIVDEVWLPRDDRPDTLEWCKTYTKALERKGRMTLTIWPDHCIIGSKGHAIEENINEALQDWSQHSKRPVKYVMKGQNCRTEFYSALEAEVVDPLDFSTGLNNELLSMLRVADRVCHL